MMGISVADCSSVTDQTSSHIAICELCGWSLCDEDNGDERM
jgi:hypothetical protein